MQIDFGEKRVAIGGTVVCVYFFVAVLSHSLRRLRGRSVRDALGDRSATDLAARFEPRE